MDGVGIGPDDAAVNPWLAAELPCLRGWLGGVPTTGTPRLFGSRAAVVPADAALDTPGLPQSGTGQTSLLCGFNAAREFGRHFGPWVPTTLRPVLAERNLLSRAVRAGRPACFANAYHAAAPGRRPAAPTLAAYAAGLLTRTAESLREGEAVASSITHHMWQRFAPDAGVPAISPRDAGRTLARLAAGADVTLFAHYDTDTVGHRGDFAAGIGALERVDSFLGGVLETLPRDALLVLASDHGNLEDARGGHTRNPVPVIAAGPGFDQLCGRVTAITDVVPALCQMLEIP